MKKPLFIRENLLGMPLTRALEISRAMSGKTYEQIALEMDLGRETIHRYFTDPDYQPPFKRIVKLAKVLGNDILIDWLCVNSGGYFIRINGTTSGMNIGIQIGNLTKEFSDVIRTEGNSMLDGIRSPEELDKLDHELQDMVVKAEEVRGIINTLRRPEARFQ